MAVFTKEITLAAPGKGTVEFTDELQSALADSGLKEGTVTVFCCHTSCSLVFIDRLVPEDDPDFTHTCEGADDMPSHIKMALTRTAEVVPFVNGRLCLGTWQGVFLWEHRLRSQQRRVVVSFQGE